MINPTPSDRAPAPDRAADRSAAAQARADRAAGTKSLAPADLTQESVAALQPGQLQRDTRVRGLFIECGAIRRTWKFQTDVKGAGHGGRVRTLKKVLGHWPAMNVRDARKAAVKVRADIDGGADLFAGKAPPAPAAASSVLTVERMFEQCAEHMRTLQRAEVTVTELLYLGNQYLGHLGPRPLAQIKPSELRAEHARISEAHGPVAANKAMRAFRSAFNLALKISDDPDALGANPVRAVTFHPERRRDAVIAPEDLRDWYARLQELGNPVRRVMHEFGLFSGLRPGTLVTLERAWVKRDAQAIEIPRGHMKSGRSFALPLSAHMLVLLERATAVGDLLHGGTAWVFPTRSPSGKQAIASRVWKEKNLRGETGHILRHTHRTVAKLAGVADSDARLLLDQKVGGIDGVYVHERALFGHLLECQETVTAKIKSLL